MMNGKRQRVFLKEKERLDGRRGMRQFSFCHFLEILIVTIFLVVVIRERDRNTIGDRELTRSLRDGAEGREGNGESRSVCGDVFCVVVCDGTLRAVGPLRLEIVAVCGDFRDGARVATRSGTRIRIKCTAN